MAGTKTITGVELVSVGTWAASTGVTTVTRADLEAMLSAQAEGLVDHAPVKLGHVSPLNDQLGDGAPAYGWVTPTHIAPNAAGRDTLFGNLVGMPAALAEVAPTAYRRRSVEIAWGVKAGAKTYAAVLTAVALLGATPPAVKGLADLVALYSEQPDAVEATSALTVVDGLEDNPVAVAMLAAAASAGATTAALDAIAAAAGARDTADVPPPTVDPDNATPVPSSTTDPDARGGPHMLTDDELRAKLGLEADADVNQALAGILAERNTGTEPVTPEGTPPVATAPATDGTATGEPATAPAAAEPELATLSAGTLAELQRDAAYARDLRRNTVLDGAVRAGKITPAERTAFAAQLAKDEEGTTTLLAAMAPRFATTELGDDSAPEAQLSAEDEAAWDAFDATTFGIKRTAQQ